MPRIVCYGDSNTYGFDPTKCAPGAGAGGRYADGIRWPSRMQELLGPGFSIVEAGLNGRTTVFEDPTEPGRNGQAFLRTVFEMNDPVDVFLIMLGTNDTKEMYCASAEMISCGLERLVRELKVAIAGSLNPGARILVVSPIAIRPASTGRYVYDFSERAAGKAGELAEYYAAVADRNGVDFWDAAQVVGPGPIDGVHLEEAEHRIFAEAISRKIREMLGK